MIRQALHIRIWQLSAILLLTSSPLKLCQVGWGQTHLFRFLQKYLIGFKTRLWLGHSRTFTELSISHFCCVIRGHCPVGRWTFCPSEVLNALGTGFSLRLSQCIGAFSFSSTLMSPSVPAAEKQPHSMRLLPAHFTFGMVLCRWWAELVSFKHDAWNWGSSTQRILFLRVWGSFRFFFCKFYVCLTWREDWVLPHCHKAQIGGVLQWCLSICRFLLSPHMIMELN